MNVKLHSKLYADIKAVEVELRDKYNYDLILNYKLVEDNERPITLNDLYDGLIKVVQRNNPELQHYFTENISTRKKVVMDYKHAFRYIVICSYGIGVTQLAKFLGIDHATVIHSRKTGNDLLDCKDQGFLRAFILLTQYYNLNFKDVGPTTENPE